MTKVRHIGILTGGGDCPGLNAVIRAITKSAIIKYGIEVIGFMDGFRGLVENNYMALDLRQVSGISHTGGTILEPATATTRLRLSLSLRKAS